MFHIGTFLFEIAPVGWAPHSQQQDQSCSTSKPAKGEDRVWHSNQKPVNQLQDAAGSIPTRNPQCSQRYCWVLAHNGAGVQCGNPHPGQRSNWHVKAASMESMVFAWIHLQEELLDRKFRSCHATRHTPDDLTNYFWFKRCMFHHIPNHFFPVSDQMLSRHLKTGVSVNSQPRRQ